MPKLITQPILFPDPSMRIEEFFGRISSGESEISIGRLRSKAGWSEPRQKPEFNEYTIMISGTLLLTSEDGTVTRVAAGQAVFVPRGESVQYSSPEEPGADYISVCIPAFKMELAHRDPPSP